MCRIAVKGEVSNCKYHPSGHIYFTLKDESGTLACVMFAGSRRGLAFAMKNGDQVVVSGNVNVYERDGRYQLYAGRIELQGAGDLYLKFVQLKQELEEMGMFDASYKQPIPRYIKKLGIVTAGSGAAVRDIINITRRRNPYVQMILYPAIVQGEGAAESVAAGLRVLDAYGVDVIIVGRGGGSIEDLWAFNEEVTARAIFECRTPVISAVGHETDTTIADFVADLRAPTPSAAAELAVYDIRDALQTLAQTAHTLQVLMERRIERMRRELERMQLLLSRVSPQAQLREKRQRLIDLEERLRAIMKDEIVELRHQIALYAQRLDGLSPLKKLGGGYGYLADGKGRALKSVAQTAPGETVEITLADGRLWTEVRQVETQRIRENVPDPA